jgi:hypothetical protein
VTADEVRVGNSICWTLVHAARGCASETTVSLSLSRARTRTHTHSVFHSPPLINPPLLNTHLSPPFVWSSHPRQAAPYILILQSIKITGILATNVEVRVRFLALPDFSRRTRSGTGSTQPRGQLRCLEEKVAAPA